MSLSLIVEMTLGYGPGGSLKRNLLTLAERPESFFAEAIMHWLEKNRNEEWAHLLITAENGHTIDLLRYRECEKFSYFVNDSSVTETSIGRGVDGLQDQRSFSEKSKGGIHLADALISFVSMGTSEQQLHLWIETENGVVIHIVKQPDKNGKLRYFIE